MYFNVSLPLINSLEKKFLKSSKNYSFSGNKPIISQINNFDNIYLRFSSFKEYLNIIYYVFSKNNKIIYAYFSENVETNIQNITFNYGIERSKLFSIILCSLIFHKGKYSIKITDFFDYFLSNSFTYRFSSVIDGSVIKTYNKLNSKYPRLPLATVIKASCYYYNHFDKNALALSKMPNVSITNTSTGWQKSFIRGDNSIKKYLFHLKKTSNKSINCVINNILHNFLLSMEAC